MAVVLYNMIDSRKAKRILEVGCGAGLPSKILFSSLMASASTLIACDLSSKMIDKVEEVVTDSDWALNENHTHKRIADSSEKVDIEAEIASLSGSQKVLYCAANNESLPFEDNVFDRYVANLSLMLVDNHKN